MRLNEEDAHSLVFGLLCDGGLTCYLAQRALASRWEEGNDPYDEAMPYTEPYESLPFDCYFGMIDDAKFYIREDEVGVVFFPTDNFCYPDFVRIYSIDELVEYFYHILGPLRFWVFLLRYKLSETLRYPLFPSRNVKTLNEKWDEKRGPMGKGVEESIYSGTAMEESW